MMDNGNLRLRARHHNRIKVSARMRSHLEGITRQDVDELGLEARSVRQPPSRAVISTRAW